MEVATGVESRIDIKSLLATLVETAMDIGLQSKFVASGSNLDKWAENTLYASYRNAVESLMGDAIMGTPPSLATMVSQDLCSALGNAAGSLLPVKTAPSATNSQGSESMVGGSVSTTPNETSDYQKGVVNGQGVSTTTTTNLPKIDLASFYDATNGGFTWSVQSTTNENAQTVSSRYGASLSSDAGWYSVNGSSLGMLGSFSGLGSFNVGSISFGMPTSVGLSSGDWLGVGQLALQTYPASSISVGNTNTKGGEYFNYTLYQQMGGTMSSPFTSLNVMTQGLVSAVDAAESNASLQMVFAGLSPISSNLFSIFNASAASARQPQANNSAKSAYQFFAPEDSFFAGVDATLSAAAAVTGVGEFSHVMGDMWRAPSGNWYRVAPEGFALPLEESVVGGAELWNMAGKSVFWIGAANQIRESLEIYRETGNVFNAIKPLGSTVIDAIGAYGEFQGFLIWSDIKLTTAVVNADISTVQKFGPPQEVLNNNPALAARVYDLTPGV